MIGDKLIIEQHHTNMASEICSHIVPMLKERFCVTVSGESGAGKSEVAWEIARLFGEMDIKAGILQQDDYFVFPPKTNHEMRRRNLEQVGPYEVKLDFLSSNLRSFKRGETLIFKPLVIFDEDRITTEELDVSEWRVLIAEGTYTSLLQFVDFRVFIDRDYHQTLESRKRRARDKFEPFVQDVLEIEHRIISQHKSMADAVIQPEFDRITYRPSS
jgi:uridine kinase